MLINANKESFIKMIKKEIDDGMGNVGFELVDGEEVYATLSLNTSTEMLVAMQKGVTSIYTFYLDKAVRIEYNDILKRKADNTLLRITNRPIEKRTPTMSSLNMYTLQAELYVQ